MIAKLALSILAVVGCGIPTWMFLILRHFADPHGLWQNLILYGLGLWLAGGIQFMLLVLLAFSLLAIWEN